MFNLLPTNLKLDIKKEYNLRRLIMFFTFVVAVQVSFLVFMFPTWLVSMYKEQIVKIEYEKMNQLLSDSNINPTTETIESINKKLNLINNSLAYVELRPMIDTVISQRNRTIFIDQFSFSSKNKDSAVLAIGGIANTRDALVSFVDRLEASGLFKKVDLPISNLAKDKDIDFTVELTVDKK